MVLGVSDQTMGTIVVLVVVAFIAAVVVQVVLALKASKKRRAALVHLAAELRFAFDASASTAVPAALRAFARFNLGTGRETYNRLTGTRPAFGRDVPISMGDYRYTTESGTGKDRRQTRHHFSYLHVRLPFAVTKRMAVRRENVFDKIAGAIGFEDIDFESAEFSRTFHVSGTDKKLVYDLFDPRMIEWYQVSDAVTLEVIGRDLLLMDGRIWKAEQFRARVVWIDAFFERWPTHLLQRLEPPMAGVRHVDQGEVE